MITLDKNYRIETNTYNYTLVQEEETEEINDKGNKIVTHNTWHFPRLGMALKRYLNETLKKCPDVESILKRIDEVEKTISNLK